MQQELEARRWQDDPLVWTGPEDTIGLPEKIECRQLVDDVVVDEVSHDGAASAERVMRATYSLVSPGRFDQSRCSLSFRRIIAGAFALGS